MSLSVTSQELLMGYTRLEYLLLGDLRSVLDEPNETRDKRWLLAVLDSLLETIPREFELREEGGYMAEIVEYRPELSDVAESLFCEHDHIFEMLAALRQRVGQDLDATSLEDQLAAELRDWMLMLMKHNKRERRVYQTAMCVEHGGE
jgi:hypothetical protein